MTALKSYPDPRQINFKKESNNKSDSNTNSLNTSTKNNATENPATITSEQKHNILKKIYSASYCILTIGIVNTAIFIIVLFSNIYITQALLIELISAPICAVLGVTFWIYVFNKRKAFHIKNKMPLVISTIGLVLSCWQITLLVLSQFIIV